MALTPMPRPARPGAPPPAAQRPAARTGRGLKRNAIDYLGMTLLLAALLTALAIPLYALWHTDRIYTGVSVAGVPVGGLSRALAFGRLQQEIGAYPLPPVNLVYGSRRFAIDPLEVRARVDLLDAVNQAYMVGRTGKAGDRVITQFGALLNGARVTPRRIYSTELLEQAITNVAATVNTSGRPATQVGVIATRAEPALTVNQAQSMAALTAALDRAPAGQPLNVPLVVEEKNPDPAAGPRSKPKDAPLFSAPLILRSDVTDVELALDPAVLSSMIVAVNPVRLDDVRLRDWLAQMASQVDLPARDARLRFNSTTGGVTVIQESLVGRKLDVDATVASVQRAVGSGSKQAPLVMGEVLPDIDSRRVAEMGIRELVATGSTYFAGSSADRVRNIEVAAEKFDGVVIPPGGIFSFNKIVEDVSAANGFEDSLVIWGDRTAVGVGGGVCQISTTVFRAAYEGGFPIVERYNHGYVVGWYGDPGMDATIFTPSVDFKFRNDTDAYLLIEPVVDSANGVATFNFYGTAPNRTVVVGKPKISDVVPAPAALYTVDESLAPGEKDQVDWAKEGMTVEVERTITEDGTTRTDTLRSKYQPWQAVYLVGPGTAIPAASVSATESVTP
jgi:vancomycin resistance protein YoaR